MSLKILYEDNHILAVLKPAGLLIQGDRSGRPTLLDIARKYLKDKYKKPGQVYLGLVHRLDRPVAGVVIFARTSKAASRLSREFRERRVKKIYRAVVEGVPRPAATLKDILLRDRKSGLSRIMKEMVQGGQQVELSYRLIKKNKNRALLEIIPETGRHHQIRAQLSASGYPIVGDISYGAKTKLSDGNIHLFCRQISFLHPVTKKELTIQARLLMDFLSRT